jgi:hypothetical protein
MRPSRQLRWKVRYCDGPSPAGFAVHPMVSGSALGHDVGRSAIDGVWLNATGGVNRVKVPEGGDLPRTGQQRYDARTRPDARIAAK